MGASLAFMPTKISASTKKISNLRLGIIGTGLRGQWMTNLCLLRNDVDIKAICDIDSEMIYKTLSIIKKLGGGVRLALAQYRELAAFSQFASDLDDATRKQLERGKRVTELMKQSQYSPLSVADMAISLFAANEGYLDEVNIEKIIAYEKSLHDYANSKHSSLMNEINEKLDYNDEIAGKLKVVLDEFKEQGVF